MASNHTVTAPLIVVFDEEQVQHYIGKGAKVPEYVSAAHIKQLVDAGLVEKDKPARASKSAPAKPPAPKTGPDGGEESGEEPPASEPTGAAGKK